MNDQHKNVLVEVTPNPDPVVDLTAFLNGENPPHPSRNNDNNNNNDVDSDPIHPIPFITATLIVDCRCHLGECVIYDDQNDSICFTNILDRTFHRLKLSSVDDDNNDNAPPQRLETYHLPKHVCAFCLLDHHQQSSNNNGEGENNNNKNQYLVAWEDGFQIYDLVSNRAFSEMSVGENVNPLGLPERLNDGRCDPTGSRFICGGYKSGNPGRPLKVYKCEYDKATKQLQHTPIVDEINTTNSICFSPNGQTMYLADTPTKQIHQYDYNVNTGFVSNKRLVHEKPVGKPDGSCCDSDGYIWNATWNRGKGTAMVDRIHPQTGRVVFRVYLPDNTSEASCCCIGGKDFDILFITTARKDILDPKSEPNAGGLYAAKLPKGMKGIKETRFVT